MVLFILMVPVTLAEVSYNENYDDLFFFFFFIYNFVTVNIPIHFSCLILHKFPSTSSEFFL